MKDLRTLRIEELSKVYNHRITDFNRLNYEEFAQKKQERIMASADLLNKKINNLIIKKNTLTSSEKGLIPEHAVYLTSPADKNNAHDLCIVVLKDIIYNAEMDKNQILSIITSEIMSSFNQSLSKDEKFNTQQFIEEINEKHPKVNIESIGQLAFYEANREYKIGMGYMDSHDDYYDLMIYGLPTSNLTDRYVENEQTLTQEM